MAKLSPIYDIRADGTRNVKGYRIALQKVATEKAGFTNDKEVDIEYQKGKIIIKERKEK